MKRKFENIFWHQGIKVFKEEFLKQKTGQLKIEHLENDVTKALINVFQQTDKRVLQKFLSFINVKDSPETFSFDFQVFDSNKYRRLPKRLMLSIISGSSSPISNMKYSVRQPIPDAAIYNNHTVILIEVKTQAPLIKEQVAAHIHHYLGSATEKKIITWEDISIIFREILQKEKIKNSFLLVHFLEFLELIGISEFRGFKTDDFELMKFIGSIPREEYLDYKRILNKKAQKFMELLDNSIRDFLSNYHYSWRCAKVRREYEGDWSAFYFHNGENDIHVNHYPNINFNYIPYGIELSLNAETQTSVKFFLNKLKKNAQEFNKVLKNIGDFYFSLYYKIQYRPKDNFYWDLIYGYPKKLSSFKIDELEDDIKMVNNRWENIINTYLFKIKNGHIVKADKKLYTEKEIDFVKKRNPRPNFVLAINKRYKINMLDKNPKKQIKFFADEIKKFGGIIHLLYHNTRVEK